MKLFFDDIGSGPPVVLIHGFPLSGQMWESQARLLTNNGFRVILPDLPGFGKSNSSQQHSIREMAEKIAEMLEFLNIDKAIIGGLSMGGYVAFELYRLSPDKFSALILCDTTHLADSEEKRDARFSLISKIEKQGSKALIDEMLPNLISDHTKQNLPELQTELTDIFSEVAPSSAINALRSMADRFDSTDLLEQISVPTLLLFGEFDKVTNLENARQMNQMISDSALVIIKNAGHYSNLEQPEKFNEAVLNFCQRIKF